MNGPSELRGGLYVDVRIELLKLSGDGVAQGGIRRAAAGEDDGVWCGGEVEPVVQRDGASGEGGKSGECAGVVELRAAHLADGTVIEGFAEEFAAGALGRSLREVGMSKPLSEERFVDVAACGASAIAIVVEASTGEFAHGKIEEDVRRTGIEGEKFRLATERPIDGGDVADAAEIIDADVASALAEDAEVKEGGEGRALSAGGEIGDAEIADDGDAKSFRKVGGLAELEGRGRGLRGLVKDGLPMQADEGGLLGNVAVPRVRRVEAAEVVMELCEFPAAGFTASGFVKAGLQVARKAGGPEFTQADGVRADLAYSVIHGVETRA